MPGCALLKRPPVRRWKAWPSNRILGLSALGGGRNPPPEASGLADLRDRLARLETKGVPPAELDVLRADLAAIEGKFSGGGAA